LFKISDENSDVFQVHAL